MLKKAAKKPVKKSATKTKKLKKVTKLVIDRKRWLTAKDRNIEHSVLLSEETGKMCCLGFLARASGALPKQILGHRRPEDVAVAWPKRVVLQTGFDSSTTQRLIEVNDDMSLYDDEREALITKGFAKLGIKVSFVGQY